MSSLQILCPNGRRQTVKTTPNTKLLQVLEEVCQKQKFLPAEDFKLIHGRKTLDLTLSVRFSNLANNAKLELVKSEKSRSENEVVIALQLESGERLQHKFSPAASLWDILLHWESAEERLKGQLTKASNDHSPSLHPVCIYMTEEVCGETLLMNTQLRKLGLVGGRAVIRYAKRPVDEKFIKDSAEKMTKEQKRKSGTGETSTGEKNETDSKSQSSTSVTETQSGSTNSNPQSRVTETQTGTIMDTQSGTTVVASASSTSKTDGPTISLNINVNIQNDGKPAAGNDVAEPIKEPATKMAKTEADQELSEPMEVEHTEVEDSVMETDETVKNGSYGPSQLEAAEALRRLNVPGLEVFTPQDFQDLPPDQQQVAQQLAAVLLPKLLGNKTKDQSKQTERQKPKPMRQRPLPPAQTGFTDFKFPEETKGKQLYKNELSDYKKEDFKPCDRNAIVYSIAVNQETTDNGDEESSSENSDLPPDFFELTESDIRSLVAAQKKKLDELENQPLMTSLMRKAKLESMYSRYDRVVIRIQFTDKLVLQGFFRPRETVFAVQKFVKENLQNKDIPFYLYTSPPKCVLKDESQTLIEAQLVPATIIYFGSSEQEASFLSETNLSDVKSRLDADMLAAECLKSISSDGNDEDGSPSTSRGKGKQPVNRPVQPKSSDTSKPSKTPSGSQSTSSKNVPKWFKIGNK